MFSKLTAPFHIFTTRPSLPIPSPLVKQLGLSFSIASGEGWDWLKERKVRSWLLFPKAYTLSGPVKTPKTDKWDYREDFLHSTPCHPQSYKEMFPSRLKRKQETREKTGYWVPESGCWMDIMLFLKRSLEGLADISSPSVERRADGSIVLRGLTQGASLAGSWHRGPAWQEWEIAQCQHKDEGPRAYPQHLGTT